MKIKSPANHVSANQETGVGAQNNATDSASAWAKMIADELSNAGISMGSNDLNDLAKGIAAGGQAGMSIALYIIQSIAEVKAKEPNQGNTGSQKTKVELSDKQVNNMIKKITTGKDSTLWISQYLKTKLSQLKEKR